MGGAHVLYSPLRLQRPRPHLPWTHALKAVDLDTVLTQRRSVLFREVISAILDHAAHVITIVVKVIRDTAHCPSEETARSPMEATLEGY